MRQAVSALGVIAASLLTALSMSAETMYLRGRVTREDGSAPGKAVGLVMSCAGRTDKVAAISGKSGEYLWRAQGGVLGLDELNFGSGTPFWSDTGMLGKSGLTAEKAPSGMCVLRAELAGYRSTTLDLSDRMLFNSPELPTLVLSPRRPGADLAFEVSMSIPGRIQQAFGAAQNAVAARKWPEAQKKLLEVTAAEPKFGPAWVLLGTAYRYQQMPSEARDAIAKAVALDPKRLQTQVMLLQANLDCKDWPAASQLAAKIIAADARHSQLEPYLDDAIALYHLRDFQAAETRLNDLLRLDKARIFPRAEYVLGLILEARGELASAREHIGRYLELQPNASDASTARTRLENLGKQQAAPDSEIDAPNLTADSPGEAPVPGGLKAFAAIARLDGEPSYQNFFLEYCRKILYETSPYTGDRIPAYKEQLQAYMAAVQELAAAGVKRADDSTVVTLSLKTADERKKTARTLRLLGWTLNDDGKSPKVQLGNQAEDGLRHAIPAALGIDEIAMRDALENGRSFDFEIRSDTARLIGGIRWAAALKNIPPFPGGMADVFSRDTRFAQAYAGLGTMSVEAALGLISGVGINALVTKYADIVELYSGSWAASGGVASTPGGKEAMPVWAKLSGANPADSAAFFRALLTKDEGRLAAFYSLVSQADRNRQMFFTASTARAQRFYEWYRDSAEMRTVANRMPGRWRGDMVRELPLDDAGRVRFPGGRAGWSESSGPDEEALLRSDRLEALVPIAALEKKRGAALDAASAGLLARHYGEWRPLFPYFEKLPGLGSAEFQALAAFTAAAENQTPAERNVLVGEWHSLVKLIAMGEQAGSLGQAAAARAFARVCEALAGPDPSPKALGVLREIAGAQGSLDEAVASSLLRLSGPRRAAFDRVREMQSAPSLDAALSAPTPASALAALSGAVYAAVLDPESLPLSEDPRFFSRHRFVPALDPKVRTAFFPTAFAPTLETSPSYISGGFMNFDEAARALPRYRQEPQPNTVPAPAIAAASSPASLAIEPAAPTEAVFRATGNLVEAPVIVTDGNRYIDSLPAADFRLLDDGEPVPIAGFESQTSAVSLALLFDTTGSMQNALPPLKSAALSLISEMRPIDSVAVYGFNVGLTELQPFTADKAAAQRAVLKAQAKGGTALYDALARVSREMAGRTGKKAIVVFTDGDDNQSVLTAEIAIARAKAVGATIYTIAQGFALRNPALLDQLAGMSKSAGGLSFAIREPGEVLKVFESISSDLKHGYLLTFQPPARSPGSHRIEVTVPASKSLAVRARAGYDLR